MRQMRWARLRRVTFAPYFLPEIFISALLLACGLGAAGALAGWDTGIAMSAALLVLAATYAAEIALAASRGWPVSWRMPLALLARDAIIPAVWTAAWFGATVVWQGQTMNVRPNMDPAISA